MQIGLFGGTFDPIHIAHLKLSNTILNTYNLDKIIFIPSGNSYFKKDVTDKLDRYEMVCLSTMSNPNFDVSNIEINRTGNSYTYETIREFRLEFPNDTFYWIMGSDTFLQLKQWKEYQYLLENTSFIVYMRPGDLLSAVQDQKTKFLNKHHTLTYIIEDQAYMISSTDIREHFHDINFDKSVLTEEVARYIEEHNLYR